MLCVKNIRRENKAERRENGLGCGKVFHLARAQELVPITLQTSNYYNGIESQPTTFAFRCKFFSEIVVSLKRS